MNIFGYTSYSIMRHKNQIFLGFEIHLRIRHIKSNQKFANKFFSTYLHEHLQTYEKILSDFHANISSEIKIYLGRKNKSFAI